MASQGPNSPGTTANDAAIGTLAWGTTSNAVSSDDSYAERLLSSFAASQYLKVTNFGFSIPSGATIDGILVEIELKTDSGSFYIQDNSVKIVKGGTISGTDKKRAGSSYWTPSEAVISFGGATDLWGVSWTDSDINSSGFGVGISARIDTGKASSTAQIDHIRITVYYTAGSGGGSSTNALLYICD